MSDRLAILIGNGRFDGSVSPPQLFGPRHDVASLGRLLSDPEIGNYIVIEILDRDSRQMVAEIEPLLAIADDLSSLLIYYAGHIIAEPGRGLYLAAADTEMDRVAETAVPLSALKAILRSCEGVDIAVFFDCCYIGPTGAVDISDIEHELRRMRTDVNTDLHVLASPATTQSVEARETATDSGFEGKLTRCIVEGVSTGAADRDGDNRTTVTELNEYLGMRMGEERPLWAGPLEGADPEVVANPHPLDGVQVDTPDVMAEVGRSIRKALRVAAYATVAAAVLIAAAFYLRDTDAKPPAIHLDEYFEGEGMPEFAGLFDSLLGMQRAIGRSGWVEHAEPLDGDGPRYGGGVTFRNDPLNSRRPGIIDLELRHWALLVFESEIFAFGIECAEGLNIAEVTVELAGGQDYTFDVRTEQASGEFFGFVAREPILRVRLVSTSTRFSARNLYLYADHELPRIGDGGW